MTWMNLHHLNPVIAWKVPFGPCFLWAHSQMNEGEDSEKKFGSTNQNISYIKVSQVITCFFLVLLVITECSL